MYVKSIKKSQNCPRRVSKSTQICIRFCFKMSPLHDFIGGTLASIKIMHKYWGEENKILIMATHFANKVSKYTILTYDSIRLFLGYAFNGDAASRL